MKNIQDGIIKFYYRGIANPIGLFFMEINLSFKVRETKKYLKEINEVGSRIFPIIKNAKRNNKFYKGNGKDYLEIKNSGDGNGYIEIKTSDTDEINFLNSIKYRPHIYYTGNSYRIKDAYFTDGLGGISDKSKRIMDMYEKGYLDNDKAYKLALNSVRPSIETVHFCVKESIKMGYHDEELFIKCNRILDSVINEMKLAEDKQQFEIEKINKSLKDSMNNILDIELNIQEEGCASKHEK